MDFLTNLHGMVVHFPIALLITSVVLEAAAMYPKFSDSLRPAALITLLLGTAGAAAAVITGPEDNARGISHLGQVHQQWAQATLLVFGLLSLIRLWSLWRKQRLAGWRGTALLAVSVIGLGMLEYTGLLGGKMVYEEAIGVRRDGQLIVPPKTYQRGN